MGKAPPITNRVKLHRMLAGGITQAELGEAVGVTRHTIIAIEHQSSMVRDADWLVELHSGNLLFCGPLQKTKDDPHSRIAQWL